MATALFAVLITACGDDPASVKEDPPVFPTFENAMPDISFFDNQPDTQAKVEFNNYTEAQFSAISLALFSAAFQIYPTMFLGADHDQANFNNGEWTWGYDYSYGGESMSMKLIAVVSGTNTNWRMTYSIKTAEVNIQNYTIIEGTLSNDGTSGTWQFNAMDADSNEEIPFIKSEFTSNEDASKQTIQTQIFDDSGTVSTMNFNKDAPEFTLSMNGEDLNNIQIFWNENSNIGYIQNNDGKRCWDAEFQDISCADIGL